MRLLVDADGCPVVDLCVQAAQKRGIRCVLVCDDAHVFQKKGAETITVSAGPDSVDLALVNRIEAGDVVVTQDYGLAAMCLARGAAVLNQNGLIYTQQNMDSLLESRHASRKARMAGKRTKGPPKRCQEQNDAFAQALKGLLEGKQETKQ